MNNPSSMLVEHITAHVLKQYVLIQTCDQGVKDLSRFVFHCSRFDLLAKILYAEAFLENKLTDWIRYVYCEHIRAFNGFNEADGSGKTGVEAFLRSFQDVLEAPASTSPSRLNTIPATQTGMILDGAHRLARAYVKHEPINFVYFDAPQQLRYDYLFFVERQLDKDVMDFLAKEYTTRYNSSHCIVVYPSASHCRTIVEATLERHGQIFFSKQIPWTRQTPHNLTVSLYHGESWLGSFADGLSGAKAKYRQCFTGRESMLFYVVALTGTKDIVAIKTELRNNLGLSNHSLHSSVNLPEKLLMAQIFLNNNTIHWLNSAQARYFDNFIHLFSLYCARAVFDSRCLVGSSVMAAYGIRDVRDLDYIDVDSNAQNCDSVERHNEYLRPFLQHLGYSVQNIICDPRLHFFYFGQKMISLRLSIALKLQRREYKDYLDVARLIVHLFSSFLRNSIFNATNRYAFFQCRKLNSDKQ